MKALLRVLFDSPQRDIILRMKTIDKGALHTITAKRSQKYKFSLKFHSRYLKLRRLSFLPVTYC